MELQLGSALPNAANDHHDGLSEVHGIDLDLNMGIGGGGNHGCSANRVQRQPQQKHHHQLLRWSPEDEMDDIDRGKHESSPTRTLPLFHWSNGNDDNNMDSSYHQPSKATSSSVNSTYVKVTMEGFGIGRKVDLSLHHSFIDLKHTLLLMFGIYNEDSDSYQLAYQDRGGQWVVAQDSSWRDFIRSTQRLKILKI